MRPGTRHYVCATKPSLVFGKRFFNLATLRETCFGVVHTFLTDVATMNSNTSHFQLLYHIPQFGVSWLDDIMKLHFQSESDIHPGRFLPLRHRKAVFTDFPDFHFYLRPSHLSSRPSGCQDGLWSGHILAGGVCLRIFNLLGSQNVSHRLPTPLGYRNNTNGESKRRLGPSYPLGCDTGLYHLAG